MLDVYLMGPYTWHGPEWMKRSQESARYRIITQFAAQIAASGLTIYSPITHSHPLLDYQDLPGTWDYWKKQDEAVMQVCLECWQLTLDGWMASKGCQAEIAMANELGKPVRYLAPDSYSVYAAIQEYKRANGIVL